MGTFDYLNMRLNGYQFHVDLMAHKERWDQQKVKDVFDTWKAHAAVPGPGALGLTWQEAAQTLATKKAGHVSAGSFVTQQFTDQGAGRHRLLPVPGDRRGERPGRGRGADRRLHVSKKGGDNRPPRTCWSSSAAPTVRTPTPRTTRATSPTTKADISKLNAMQKKCAAGHREREGDLAVPRPRRAAGLRQQRDDPGAAGLHQERHRST